MERHRLAKEPMTFKEGLWLSSCLLVLILLAVTPQSLLNWLGLNNSTTILFFMLISGTILYKLINYFYPDK